MSNETTKKIKEKYGSLNRFAKLNGWNPNFVSLVIGRFMGKRGEGKSGAVISKLKNEGLWVNEDTSFTKCDGNITEFAPSADSDHIGMETSPNES